MKILRMRFTPLSVVLALSFGVLVGAVTNNSIVSAQERVDPLGGLLKAFEDQQREDPKAATQFLIDALEAQGGTITVDVLALMTASMGIDITTKDEEDVGRYEAIALELMTRHSVVNIRPCIAALKAVPIIFVTEETE
jgi:hypothetical protein